jgi:hypothetical protein
MNFVVAQMKLLMLDYIQVDSRYWALRVLFYFNVRTGGLTLSWLLSPDRRVDVSANLAFVLPCPSLPFLALPKLHWTGV